MLRLHHYLIPMFFLTSSLFHQVEFDWDKAIN